MKRIFFFCSCSTVPSFSRHVHCTILCTSAFDVGFISPSDDHSHQAAHQAVLREGEKKGAPAEDQKAGRRGGGGKEHSTGEQWKKVAKGIENENHSLVTKRLAAGGSIRQCHAYDYACTVWGSLGDAGGGWGGRKKKTSVVMSPEFEALKKKEKKRKRTYPNKCNPSQRVLVPGVPPEKRLLSFTASSPLSASSN